MCLVKKPKVVSSTAAENKEVPVLRNPYLDGLPSILRARRGGVQSLTIRRGGASGTANTPTTTPTPTTPARPPSGGNGGGGLTDDQRRQASILAALPGTYGHLGRQILSKDTQ